jgi:hypothetical protein
MPVNNLTNMTINTGLYVTAVPLTFTAMPSD